MTMSDQPKFDKQLFPFQEQLYVVYPEYGEIWMKGSHAVAMGKQSIQEKHCPGFKLMLTSRETVNELKANRGYIKEIHAGMRAMKLGLDDDTVINEWGMEFYSPVTEEWEDYSYWTLSDDRQSAVEMLQEDEANLVEHLSVTHRTWTLKEFRLNQGENSFSLIRDL